MLSQHTPCAGWPAKGMPQPYSDRLGTLGPFRDGLLGQPRLLFQAKRFHPRMDRLTRGPAPGGRPFTLPSRAKAERPRQLVPPSGLTRQKGSGGARPLDAAAQQV